jgi:hypothetical protein
MTGASDLFPFLYLVSVVLVLVVLVVLAVLLCGVALAGRRYLLVSARLRELQTDLLVADLEAEAGAAGEGDGTPGGATAPRTP